MVEETLTQFAQTDDVRASDHMSPCIVLDIESLAQPSGSPKITRALSRKLSYRADRSTSTDQEEDTDRESAKKLLMKVNSQLEPLKLPLITAKSSSTSTTLMDSNLLDTRDQWSRGFNRFMAINPRNILLIFATMSSMGTLLLIYFTLAISRTI